VSGVPAAWVLDEAYARYRAGRMGEAEAVHLVRDAVDVTEYGAREMLGHAVRPSVRYGDATTVVASGVLNEATETWTDLDEMLAAELPPCRLARLGNTVTAGPCGRPSVALARAKCSACGLAAQFGVCAEHAALLRAADAQQGGMRCTRCGTPRAITFGGLS
jgi:hypothetical protein